MSNRDLEAYYCYMGCPAVLKQPDALPGRAPPKTKKYIFEVLLIHL
jgi:hypothetical protein